MKVYPFARSFIPLAVLALAGCDSGYTKQDGKWTYIVINEAVGREVRKIDAHLETFRVLDDPDYAADKDHVYRHGLVLEGMDGASFEFLDGNNYARDADHIYYRDCILLDVERDSFRVLDFPYSRDANTIYCGSLRMNVANPEAFRVLTSKDTGTSFFYSTEDLVRRLGDEFADHRVLYDSKNKNARYIVASSRTGTATDGVWIYQGPKRLRRAE